MTVKRSGDLVAHAMSDAAIGHDHLVVELIDHGDDLAGVALRALRDNTPGVSLFACSPCFAGKHGDCDPGKPCGCTVCYEYVRVTRA